MAQPRSLKKELNKLRSKIERMYEDLLEIKEEAFNLSAQEEDQIDLDAESSEMLASLSPHLDAIDNKYKEAVECLGGEV